MEEIIGKLSEVFEFSHEISRSVRRQFKAENEKLEAFAAQYIQMPVKKKKLRKPLANSTINQNNELTSHEAETEMISDVGDDGTFPITHDENGNYQPLKPNETLIQDTPLSSKVDGPSGSTGEIEKPKQLKDITNRIYQAANEAGQSNDSTFKVPQQLASLVPTKAKRCIVFDDLNSDDEDSIIESEDVIKRPENLPPWCLGRNFKTKARQQSHVNMDVCSTFFGSHRVPVIDPLTIFPETSPTRESLARNESSIYHDGK